MQIQNPKATEIIRDQAGLTIAEGFPQNLSSSIVPVIDMTPFIHAKSKIRSASRGTTGSSTIYAVAATKRFFATGAYISFNADASCDCTEFWIGCVQDGVNSTRMLSIMRNASVAENRSQYANFPFPIEIDSGTNITLNQTYSAGSASSRMLVFGYETDK